MTYEVVWNGAIARQLAEAEQRPAPVEDSRAVRFPDPHMAQVDPLSARACDRILVYLHANPQAEHYSESVAKHLGIPADTVSVMLRRFLARGFIQVVGQGSGQFSRRRIYRLKAAA